MAKVDSLPTGLGGDDVCIMATDGERCDVVGAGASVGCRLIDAEEGEAARDEEVLQVVESRKVISEDKDFLPRDFGVLQDGEEDHHFVAMLWDERRGIFFVKRRKLGHFGSL